MHEFIYNNHCLFSRSLAFLISFWKYFLYFKNTYCLKWTHRSRKHSISILSKTDIQTHHHQETDDAAPSRQLAVTSVTNVKIFETRTILYSRCNPDWWPMSALSVSWTRSCVATNYLYLIFHLYLNTENHISNTLNKKLSHKMSIILPMKKRDFY